MTVKQKGSGWHLDITVTMRYAHLAQDHLQEAITLNPMA